MARATRSCPVLRRHAACALLACLVLVAPGAPAAAPSVQPLVARQLAAIRAARGPEAYAALRELWQAWEEIDPVQVEEALTAVAEDGALGAPLRAYAGALRAHARWRRGDRQGAELAIRRLGFVTEWLVVGPFDNEGKGGLGQAFVPEQELGEPVLLERAYQGKQRPVRWRPSPPVHPHGWLDLGALVRPRTKVCAYAATFLRQAAGTGRAAAPRQLSLWVGATGAFRLFWNEQAVLEDKSYRDLDVDRFAVAVPLEPGHNRLTVKVCADDSPPAVAVRVAEPDGSPATGIEASAAVEASTEAAARQRERRAAGPAPRRGAGAGAGQRGAAVAGPMQEFAARLAASPADPPLMEAYARYLLATGGDDPTDHQARDLAQRAAQTEPTVARLLLASRLAEDRNQRRDWVERASALARTTEERIAVRLAQASLARSGPNWREAVPLYDEVLRLDPDNAAAILGRVDLYVEAGLKRTALGALRRAADEQPSSVALLRALAAQLRAVGHDAEAAEAEARYAALRFDDAGLLQQHVELAVARRDADGARHWEERLLRIEPASGWAHGVVARARRALGDSEAAAAVYRRQLEVAPEDVGTMRALSDLYGERGDLPRQIELLERIVQIRPQAKRARAYLEHLAPAAARDDEQYAWPPQRFLAARRTADRAHERRTLRQLTVTTVMPNGLATRFHQVVFQPLTEEQAARSRQYAFVYHADRQVVELRAARVYRRDGRVDEAVESGEAPADDPSLALYTLARVFFVQLPRLEVGDVVELRYRIDDVATQNDMEGQFGEVVYLGSTEPVASAEYVLVAPQDKPLYVAATALPGLERTVREAAGRRVYRFAARDVPALRPEPRMPPLAELAAQVHASTFPNWEAVGKWYWGLVHDRLDVDDVLRRRVRELTADLGDERAKIEAVFRYAASRTRYVALELGIESIRPRRAALTLARGWGDCKDKAALIVAMLRELGIEAELVLVRTGLRGQLDTSIASLAPFDHAVAYVPSLDLYLDATAEASGAMELPALDRAAVGLRITGGAGRLVRLPDPPAESSAESRRFELTLLDGGALAFRAELRAQGVSAPAWRERFQAEATRRERIGAALASLLGPVELAPGTRGVRAGDLELADRPATMQLEGRAEARAESGSYRVPVGPSYGLTAQYASLARRERPVVLGAAQSRADVWTLRLRPGQRVLSTPEPKQVEASFGSFALAVDAAPDRVTVSTTLTLRRSRIQPGEYDEWRAFCEAVDGAAGPRVVVGE